ncbi:hypothetical protein V5O48_013698, partial [Marasmius crinis-equi]
VVTAGSADESGDGANGDRENDMESLSPLLGATFGDHEPGPGMIGLDLFKDIFGENGEAGLELDPVTGDPSTKCNGRGPFSDCRLFCLEVAAEEGTAYDDDGGGEESIGDDSDWSVKFEFTVLDDRHRVVVAWIATTVEKKAGE